MFVKIFLYGVHLTNSSAVSGNVVVEIPDYAALLILYVCCLVGCFGGIELLRLSVHVPDKPLDAVETRLWRSP